MIRRAVQKDIPEIHRLLAQVLAVHAKGRPDLFIAGTRKYTDAQLLSILEDDTRPVFVHTNEEDRADGYAFCIFEETKGMNNMRDEKSLYIDDLCVDDACRRKGIARCLYRYVCAFAKASGCRRVTLNVWELNPDAKRFYEAMGMRPLKTVMENVL